MPMSQAERQAKYDAWKKGLVEKGKLSAEALAAIEASPDAMQYVVESQLAQSDYSRLAQEAAAAKQAAVADAQRLTEWRAQAEATIKQANLTAQQERTQREAIERAFHEGRTKLATTYQLDESTLNEVLPKPDLASPTVIVPPIPQPNSNGNGNGNYARPNYVTREEGLSMVMSQIELADKRAALANRHKAMFNEDLEDFSTLVKEANRKATESGMPWSNRLIDEEWRERYNVAGKEEEIRNKQIEDIKRQAFEDGRKQGLTETSLPIPGSGGARQPGAPGLRNLLTLPEGQTEKVTSDDEVVSRAVMTYRDELAKAGQSA